MSPVIKMQMTHLRSNFTSLHSYLNFFFSSCRYRIVLEVHVIYWLIYLKSNDMSLTQACQNVIYYSETFFWILLSLTQACQHVIYYCETFFFWILVSWSLPSYRYPVVIEVHVVYLKSNDMSLAAIHAKLLTDIASMLQVYVYFFFRDFFSCQRYRRSMLQVYIYLILFGFSFVSMISPQHASGACLSRLFFCWFFLWYRLHASGVCLFSIVFYFDIACLCVEGYMPRPPLQEGHK